MGGKNAIIVDDDADLDEAVVGVLQSAFGYAGPEVLGLLAGDRARRRSTTPSSPAWSRPASALPVGPADDPETVVGPVIDAEARERIEEYRRIAAAEGRVVARRRRRPAGRRGATTSAR